MVSTKALENLLISPNYRLQAVSTYQNDGNLQLVKDIPHLSKRLRLKPIRFINNQHLHAAPLEHPHRAIANFGDRSLSHLILQMLKNHPKQFLRATLLRNLDVSYRNRWRLSRLLLWFVSQPVSIAPHSFARPRLAHNSPRLPRLALSFEPVMENFHLFQLHKRLAVQSLNFRL